MRPQGQSVRLAADIGGTFTDVAAFDEKTGRLHLGKTLTTHARLVDGIVTGTAKADVQISDASVFLHGSTIAINTLLERNGSRSALITTEGFRDVYEIGRINRPDAYNLFFQKHRPLIDRASCFEVRERLRADGSVHVALDESSVHSVCDRLEEQNIESVAIVLLHSYRNPAHEIRVRDIVATRLPSAFVTTSHELSQEYREFERSSTAAANAYIGPRVRTYLSEIDKCLGDAKFPGQFLLVQSTGGLYDFEQARQQCVRLLESGPAAGVVGAKALCEQLELREAIAFDMGGTTAKAGIISQGEILTATTALIGPYSEALPIQIPMIDIFEVGTGGGSIAKVDAGRALRVGPQSAGSIPGPACYGRGGREPTVTDANLVLGRLDPRRFLGGEMPLDSAAAENAIDEFVARPLGVTRIRAAEGILKIAANAMSHAVRGVTTQRGLDAAAFSLIAYGGAGPLHATAVAREIGIRRVIVPPMPGNFCAFGMLFSDLRCDVSRTWFMRLADISFDEFGRLFQDLVASGKRTLTESGVTPASTHVTFACDMRYVGQEHAVTVDLPKSALSDRAAIKQKFDEVYLRRYSVNSPGEPAEVVGLRVAVIGVMNKPAPAPIETGTATPPAEARTGERQSYFSEIGTLAATPTYLRSKLRANNVIAGPALIEEYASTTVVLPGDRLEVDGSGSLVIAAGAS